MRIIEHFFQLIAPHDCVGCGREGSLICGWCASGALSVVPERCYRCYRLSEDYKTCTVCRHHSVLRRVWIRSEYGPAAKKIIHALKFNYAKDAARVIAKELTATLPHLPVDTIITHVPAATSHVRQRGFDQSALVARELARKTGLRHYHLLGRLGQQRQVGASRNTRQEQMAHAFRPLSPSMIKDARILLVDDVLTTGSTLESAGLTLKQAGAKTVDGVVFAQAR